MSQRRILEDEYLSIQCWEGILTLEASYQACFDFADIIKASGVNVRVGTVTVARDDVETGTRDPIVVSDDGDTPPMVPEVIYEPAQDEAAGSMYETIMRFWYKRFHYHTEAIPVHRITCNREVRGSRDIGFWGLSRHHCLLD
ncbi:hypothetical protein Tco_1282635 [Tanacetum coccineum]